MSGLDAVIPRLSIVANTIARWTWGDRPSQIVRVVVREEYGVRTAVVYGARGRYVDVLQRVGVASVEPVKDGWEIATDTGKTWRAVFTGCSACSTPAALKRMDVMRAER